MTNQYALAAAIRRADMRLRRSIITHGHAADVALFYSDHRTQRDHLVHMDRAERRLWLLCRRAPEAGPARAAADAASATLEAVAEWTAAD